MLDNAYLAHITYMVTHMVTLLSFLLQPFLHVSVFTMHPLQEGHSWVLLLYSVCQSLTFDWSV